MSKKNKISGHEVYFSSRSNSSSTKNIKVDNTKQQSFEKGITISLHKDELKKFITLLKKYEIAIYNKNYTIVDQKQFFTNVLNFYVDKLNIDNQFQKAPEQFIKSVTRSGRRAKTERTCNAVDRAHVFFGVSKKTYDNYYNVMFSFLKLNNNLDPIVFSTSYFFYDLNMFISQNLKAIIKYQIKKME